MKALRDALDLPSGVPVPTAVGFLGWVLDKTEASDDPRIPSILDELPAAIWFSFGNDLNKWIAQVRAHDEKKQQEGRQPGYKTLVFVITSSVEEAKRAMGEWQVDVIVVQGEYSCRMLIGCSSLRVWQGMRREVMEQPMFRRHSCSSLLSLMLFRPKIVLPS